MAKKKHTKNKSNETAAQEAAAVTAGLCAREAAEVVAEDVFPPPRRILLIVACTAVLFVILATLGWFNGLQFAKRALLLVAGAWQPSLVAVPDTSLDAFTVFSGLVLLAGGALIHPALGIAALVFFRPWDDGYTYAGDNAYFLWGICLITTVWAVGQLARGARLRALVPTALLAAFLCVAAIGCIATVRFDRTFERLLLWFGYLALFTVSANALRDRRHIGVVLWSFALVLTVEAIYAIMQFHYLLPFLRYNLMHDPALRLRYFGVDAFTPELIHRFNMNRAFGSTLFPNALAGFLILALPLTFAMALDGWRRFLPIRKLPPEPPADWQRRRYLALGSGMAAWFLATLFCYVVCFIPTAWALTEPSPLLNPVPLSIISAAFGILPGLAVGAAMDKRGPGVCMLGTGTLVLTACVPVQCWALWLSYSRGGMLALFVASATAFALYFLGGVDSARRVLEKFPRWLVPVSAACVLVILGAAWIGNLGAAAVAQENASTPTASAPPPENPAANLREEGYEVTLQDLANPATFRIRLTYWRIGWDVFRAYAWCGAGLGNFEAVYPFFQKVGDPPVRDAHNGYLQAYCETGIVGGTLLLLFWVYFVLWGAFRVLGERNPAQRLLLAGIYAGVLAFAAHAFIDIHFSHAGLMMFASILAGVFFAVALRRDPGPDAPPRHWARQWPMLPVLLLIALVFGATTRIYLKNAAISRANLIGIDSTQIRDDRLEMLRFFLDASSFSTEGEARPSTQVYVQSARTFIPDFAALSTLGPLFEQRTDGSMRKLEPGERLPQNAVLAVAFRKEARAKTLEMAEIWAADMERADARFPHDPAQALHISTWYRTLAERKDVEDRLTYAIKMVDWAERAVQRNPRVADLRFHLGRAYWLLGQVKGPGKGETEYVAAVNSFSEARKLLSSLPIYHDVFAEYAGYLSDAYRLPEKPDMTAEYLALRTEYAKKAAQYAALKVEAAAEAERIRQERMAMGLHPEG